MSRIQTPHEILCERNRFLVAIVIISYFIEFFLIDNHRLWFLILLWSHWLVIRSIFHILYLSTNLLHLILSVIWLLRSQLPLLFSSLWPKHFFLLLCLIDIWMYWGWTQYRLLCSVWWLLLLMILEMQLLLWGLWI